MSDSIEAPKWAARFSFGPHGGVTVLPFSVHTLVQDEEGKYVPDDVFLPNSQHSGFVKGGRAKFSIDKEVQKWGLFGGGVLFGYDYNKWPLINVKDYSLEIPVANSEVISQDIYGGLLLKSCVGSTDRDIYACLNAIPLLGQTSIQEKEVFDGSGYESVTEDLPPYLHVGGIAEISVEVPHFSVGLYVRGDRGPRGEGSLFHKEGVIRVPREGFDNLEKLVRPSGTVSMGVSLSLAVDNHHVHNTVNYIQDTYQENKRNRQTRTDGDGLTDGDERALNLNSLDPDSDNDGKSDGTEASGVKEGGCSLGGQLYE